MQEYVLTAGGGGGAGADEFKTECQSGGITTQRGGAGGNADTRGSAGAAYTLFGADIEGGGGGFPGSFRNGPPLLVGLVAGT